MAIEARSPLNARFIDGGLKLDNAAATQYVTVKIGAGTTAPRTLTFVTGDADRTITLTGDVTLPQSSLDIGKAIALRFGVARY